jgi:hypothetical protein
MTDAASAAVTPEPTRTSATSSAVTLGTKAHVYLALGGILLFAGGLGVTVPSPSAAQPVLIQGAASGRVAVVDTTADSVTAEVKRARLLALFGSWAGDDFEECLDLAYASRSAIEVPDVPA